jgi:hypothetical protein
MRHEPCVVCPHVFSHERTVKILIHHQDGTWQAACGERDHASDCSDFAVVGLDHLLERQPDLVGLEQLPADHFAERSEDRWIVSPFDEVQPD